ncbi:hypothetical protein [Amphibacillus sediminis]|uniref:hypothetical protein n=1 Tax=Amphibacillus sediminis TaxID=360185 RepID=UPI00082AAE22|nr:hypothetical protein [Amphibacillus sediminis]
MHKLELSYTPEMEKAMHQSHGCCYARYETDMNKRLEVEQAREVDHQKGLEIKAELDRQAHR